MVHLSVDPTLRRQLDRYWRQNDFPNRSAAWKWLAWWAMQQGAKPTPQELAEMEDGNVPWNR